MGKAKTQEVDLTKKLREKSPERWLNTFKSEEIEFPWHSKVFTLKPSEGTRSKNVLVRSMP